MNGQIAGGPSGEASETNPLLAEWHMALQDRQTRTSGGRSRQPYAEQVSVSEDIVNRQQRRRVSGRPVALVAPHHPSTSARRARLATSPLDYSVQWRPMPGMSARASATKSAAVSDAPTNMMRGSVMGDADGREIRQGRSKAMLNGDTRSVVEAQHEARGAERLAALERIEHGGLVEPGRQRLGFERGGD